MALRTRPFKFNLWKVATVQRRICGNTVQRSIAIEDCDNRQKVPISYEEFMKSIEPRTDSPSTEFKEGDWFSLQKDVAPRALAVFLQEQNSLQARLCLGEDIASSAKKSRSCAADINPSNACGALPENFVGSSYEFHCTGCDKLFDPYMQTADDILVGSENNQVETSRKVVDPNLAAEFFGYSRLFSQRWESMEGILSQLGTKVEIKTEIGNKSSLLACPQNHRLCQTSQNCLHVDPKVASDLIHPVDLCLNIWFSLEEPPHKATEFINSLSDSQDLTVTSPDSFRRIPGMLYFDDSTKKSSPSGADKSGKPTLDHLRNMHDYLVESLPNIFVQRHEYRIYRRDVVFENNFLDPPKTTVGVSAYSLQVAKLRIGAHFKYANVRLHLLKSTTHEDEGCIRISWRISGIPQVRAFMFWKFLPWNYKSSKSTESEWREGISTFYLDGEGRIAKHQMDRVIQDKGPVAKEEIAKIPGLAV